MIFRGALQTRLERTFSPVAAIALTTGLFLGKAVAEIGLCDAMDVPARCLSRNCLRIAGPSIVASDKTQRHTGARSLNRFRSSSMRRTSHCGLLHSHYIMSPDHSYIWVYAHSGGLAERRPRLRADLCRG